MPCLLDPPGLKFCLLGGLGQPAPIALLGAAQPPWVEFYACGSAALGLKGGCLGIAQAGILFSGFVLAVALHQGQMPEDLGSFIHGNLGAGNYSSCLYWTGVCPSWFWAGVICFVEIQVIATILKPRR